MTWGDLSFSCRVASLGSHWMMNINLAFCIVAYCSLTSKDSPNSLLNSAHRFSSAPYINSSHDLINWRMWVLSFAFQTGASRRMQTVKEVHSNWPRTDWPPTWPPINPDAGGQFVWGQFAAASWFDSGLKGGLFFARVEHSIGKVIAYLYDFLFCFTCMASATVMSWMELKINYKRILTSYPTFILSQSYKSAAKFVGLWKK